MTLLCCSSLSTSVGLSLKTLRLPNHPHAHQSVHENAFTKVAALCVEWSHTRVLTGLLQCSAHENAHERFWSRFTLCVFICCVPRQFIGNNLLANCPLSSDACRFVSRLGRLASRPVFIFSQDAISGLLRWLFSNALGESPRRAARMVASNAFWSIQEAISLA